MPHVANRVWMWDFYFYLSLRLDVVRVGLTNRSGGDKRMRWTSSFFASHQDAGRRRALHGFSTTTHLPTSDSGSVVVSSAFNLDRCAARIGPQ